MSELPEPFRRAIAELEAADRRNADDISQLRNEHDEKLVALQNQYEKMEENQIAILQRLGDVPTKNDIRLAVAEGITEPLKNAYASVPLHIANQLAANANQIARENASTDRVAGSWLKISALVAAVSFIVDIIMRFLHLQ